MYDAAQCETESTVNVCASIPLIITVLHEHEQHVASASEQTEVPTA
jgi:hypothetical protein